MTESRRLAPSDFEDLWNAKFKEVAKEANDQDAYTARRFILQARLGEAELQLVRWTRWGVFIALVGMAASLVIGVVGLVLG